MIHFRRSRTLADGLKEFDMPARPWMCLVLAVSLHLTATACADDWPTYRRDYSRSGSTGETLDATALGQLWVRDGDAPRPAWPGPARWDAFGKIPDLRSMRNYDPVYHITSVGDSLFYASSADDSVWCVDVATGQTRWSFATQGPVRNAPTWFDGKLYFGSDDGSAYCVEAKSGSLVWKSTPRPDERLVINDGRLISFAPIRTGVVVADGTAYFGASLLPWKKSYLCAVDAKTGEATGPGRYVVELENLTLEGALVISARRLIAPQGRVAPLVFDRFDGKSLGSLHGATGGCFMLVTDDDQVVLGGGRGKGQVTAAEITVANPKNKTRVVSFPRGNAVVVRGDKIWLLDDHLVTALNRKSTAKHWQKDIPNACELLLAGDALFIGSRDIVLALNPDTGEEIWRQPVKGRAFGLALANGRLFVSTDEGAIHAFSSSTKPVPMAKDPVPKAVAPAKDAKEPEFVLHEGPTLRFTGPDRAVVRWKTREPSPSIVEFGEDNDLRVLKSESPTTSHEIVIDGLRKNRLYRYRIRAADGGKVHATAFMECDTNVNFQPVTPAVVKLPIGENLAAREAAEAILRAAKQDQGFCLLIGIGDGRLAYEIATRSKLSVVAVETDGDAVAKARRAFVEAKVNGPRITVLHVKSLAELPLPPCFANVVAFNNALSDGGKATEAEKFYRFVRPEGGCFIGGGTKAVDRAPWNLVAGRLSARAQWIQDRGDWLKLTRGRLPGASDWTHQYGSPDNSSFVGEELADAAKTDDLEVVWFGQPGPRFNIDRNPRKPAPLAAKGRLFLQGMRRVASIDAFNGTIQWSLELPRFARYNIPHDCSNWCCDDDSLYLAMDDQCWTLSAADGAVRNVLHLNQFLDAEKSADADWGYLARVGDDVLGSTVKRGSHFLGYWGGENWYDAKTGQRFLCSNNLFAYDTAKGKLRWTWSKGTIINTTITVADGRVTFIESRNPDLAKNPSGQIGDAIWKDMWMVSLDLATGQPVWSQPFKAAPSTASFYLAQGEGKIVVTTSDQGTFGIRTFSPKTGEPGWASELAWEADHHGKHLSRPAIANGHLILRPFVLDLATGKLQYRGFPPGHGCGSYCLTKNMVIFRGGEVVLWDLDKNTNTRYPRLRPDCWISTIPANGMLLSPEGGGGCSCGQWMEMSVGFLPRSLSPASRGEGGN
jgi:outer membrane protein assembly factor BamB